jgi:hypothetical protein
MFHVLVRRLNHHFDEDQIEAFACKADAFAPGTQFDASLLAPKGSKLEIGFQSYLDNLPGGCAEILRSVIYYALTTTPPTPVTFAWAPAPEYEITTWQPSCGITVLVKSPSPELLARGA